MVTPAHSNEYKLLDLPGTLEKKFMETQINGDDKHVTFERTFSGGAKMTERYWSRTTIPSITYEQNYRGRKIKQSNSVTCENRNCSESYTLEMETQEGNRRIIEEYPIAKLILDQNDFAQFRLRTPSSRIIITDQGNDTRIFTRSGTDGEVFLIQREKGSEKDWHNYSLERYDFGLNQFFMVKSQEMQADGSQIDRLYVRNPEHVVQYKVLMKKTDDKTILRQYFDGESERLTYQIRTTDLGEGVAETEYDHGARGTFAKKSRTERKELPLQ